MRNGSCTLYLFRCLEPRLWSHIVLRSLPDPLLSGHATTPTYLSNNNFKLSTAIMAVIAKLLGSTNSETSTTSPTHVQYAANLATLRLGRKRRLLSSSDNSDEDAVMIHRPTVTKHFRIDDSSSNSNNVFRNNNNFATALNLSTKDQPMTHHRRRSSLSSSSSSSYSPSPSPSPSLSSSATTDDVNQQEEDPRSLSPAAAAVVVDCRLPIRKRYLRSVLHCDVDDASVPKNVAEDSRTSSSPSATSPSSTPTQLQSPVVDALTAVTDALTAVKPPCLRAGVIRHSSNPQRCLAFYYMPKQILC